MRRIGAIGNGADRRGVAQTDAVDTGDRQEFSALAAARRGNSAAEVSVFERSGYRFAGRKRLKTRI
jgi:hypothetical protein